MPVIADGFIHPFEGSGLGLELTPFVLGHPEAIVQRSGQGAW